MVRSLLPLGALQNEVRRFTVWLLTGFACFALLLASPGIYGLISYSVSRRTQEIGIQMALGASAFEVQRRIVMRTLGLASPGTMADLIAIAALAGYLPARRASRVDPMVCLRAE